MILAPTVKIPGSEPEYVFIIGDKTRGAGMVFVPARDNGFGWPQIRPMFEYPSDKHLGELLR